MDRIAEVLNAYPEPAYAVSAFDFTILVANRSANTRLPLDRGGLAGLDLRDVTPLDDFNDHPALRAVQGGVHSHYWGRGDLRLVASRLPEVPTRPPIVLVTARKGFEEPLAVVEHLRIIGTFQIANAIDDVERTLAVAARMVASAQDRFADMARIWHERTEAYAESGPCAVAELGLMDAANERSERDLAHSIDGLSVRASTVKPLQRTSPLPGVRRLG